MSSKIVYPTGVENHGGFLRIWFMYQGKRFRESTGLPDTSKNRKLASEIRQSVNYDIKTGNFDYYKRFPESKNAKKFTSSAVEAISVADFFDKWLVLKKPEISLNTYRRYVCKLETCTTLIGKDRNLSTITSEDLIKLRNDLLSGSHRPARKRKTIKKGRTVATVNDYITCAKGVIKFAFENGYITKDPTISVGKLKRSRTIPDPLTSEEFDRLLDAFTNEQARNLWIVAVYTGLRHGELCALAWEDIDLYAGTLTIRRNWTSVKIYTLPKTEAGTRVITLLEPAIQALRSQQALTKMRQSIDVEVNLREINKTRIDKCTFVFNPAVNTIGRRNHGERYSLTSISDMWDRAMKKAKLRHRNAYQSRHTYACWMLSAGANPSFIASQMGHTSAQMIFTVYGNWMPENNASQVELLNAKFSQSAPSMPHNKTMNKKILY
ncbi:site-specific integrase [Photorhabdus sp. P32]|uniref:site-specific integrase n=1 Tax=Photorhabdus sp. P32 TaxID=3117549 RepID=UPI00311B3D09